ncbi:hypothetical protein F4821DRAFT_247733 [Hypoxylon rubiginosum]|uniref:Uncharacterized protein n=1 Tax=Hypoxylon rubiginosum TaxID=110542 RepID=A0ACC0CP89_9PEZI|nr:hypothetical protein F4821DRAFT_247733 [Hypoxylon rubiginosum]
MALPCPIPGCGKSFKNPHCVKSHIECFHIGTVCEWPGCNVQKATEDELRVHIRDEHNPTVGVDKTNADGSIAKKYECKWCHRWMVTPHSAVRCAYIHVRREFVKKLAAASISNVMQVYKGVVNGKLAAAEAQAQFNEMDALHTTQLEELELQLYQNQVDYFNNLHKYL